MEVTIRVIGTKINRLLKKEKTENEGIPYQTFISSTLHKYVTNQFYEKDEVLKSIKLLADA